MSNRIRVSVRVALGIGLEFIVSVRVKVGLR